MKCQCQILALRQSQEKRSQPFLPFSQDLLRSPVRGNNTILVLERKLVSTNLLSIWKIPRAQSESLEHMYLFTIVASCQISLKQKVEKGGNRKGSREGELPKLFFCNRMYWAKKISRQLPSSNLSSPFHACTKAEKGLLLETLLNHFFTF